MTPTSTKTAQRAAQAFNEQFNVDAATHRKVAAHRCPPSYTRSKGSRLDAYYCPHCRLLPCPRCAPPRYNPCQLNSRTALWRHIQQVHQP